MRVFAELPRIWRYVRGERRFMVRMLRYLEFEHRPAWRPDPLRRGFCLWGGDRGWVQVRSGEDRRITANRDHAASHKRFNEMLEDIIVLPELMRRNSQAMAEVAQGMTRIMEEALPAAAAINEFRQAMLAQERLGERAMRRLREGLSLR